MQKSKNFSSFDVSIKTGSKRKKRLSNHLEIRVNGDRASVSQKLTIREARALQKFLNDNLSTSSSGTQSTSTSA